MNVEPALKAGEPLGEHYVQGHVDGVGRVTRAEPEGVRLRVVAPPELLLRYCVPKGSIAVQRVSLAIATRDDEGEVCQASVRQLTGLRLPG